MPEIPAHYSNRISGFLSFESRRRTFSLPSVRLLRSQKDAISLFFLSPFPFLSLFPYPRLIGKLAGFNRCKQRNKRIKRRKEKKKYIFVRRKALASSRLIVLLFLDILDESLRTLIDTSFKQDGGNFGI